MMMNDLKFAFYDIAMSVWMQLIIQPYSVLLPIWHPNFSVHDISSNLQQEICPHCFVRISFKHRNDAQ